MTLHAQLCRSIADLDERYDLCPQCQRRGRGYVRHLILRHEVARRQCERCQYETVATRAHLARKANG